MILVFGGGDGDVGHGLGVRRGRGLMAELNCRPWGFGLRFGIEK